MSCYKGHDKIVQVLLDAGVKVNVSDKVSEILVLLISKHESFSSTIQVIFISRYLEILTSQ